MDDAALHELAEQLRSMAAWLGLATVAIEGAGSWRYACAGCCSSERSRRAAERPRRAQRRTCFRVSAIRKASSSDWSAFSRGSQWVW